MRDLFHALSERVPQAVVGLTSSDAYRADGRLLPVLHKDFLRWIDAWSAVMQEIQGDQIALYLEDSLEFAAALLAAWADGKTVWLCADTLPVHCRSLLNYVDAFVGSFPSEFQPHHLPARPTLANSATSSASYSSAALDRLKIIQPQALALLVFTSGSTGAPQPIPKKFSQLLSEIQTLESAFGSQMGHAAIVATVSHQHIYGLLFKVLWPLAAGRAIHARSTHFPEQLVAMLRQGDCVLVASPAQLKRLPDHLDWRSARPHVRAIFSSGGPLAGDVATHLRELLGHVPLEVYGSSESGGIAWRQQQQSLLNSWQSLPGVEWRLSADGLLEVRSPHLPDGHWLRMADRVQAMDNGRFILQGRSDRIVKIEEKRISLQTMERTLMACALVEDARVIVEPEMQGQRQKLGAFIVLSSAGQAQLAKLGKHRLNQDFRQELALHVDAVALPRRWRYLAQLPVNAQGKTTEAQLLALLDASGLDADTDADTGIDADMALARPRSPRLKVCKREPLRVVLQLTVPASLLYFDGHFPVTPILPGVVQVDWAISYGRQYFTIDGAFRAIHALKFQHVIQPEEPIMLELTHDLAKNTLHFRYFSDAGQHAGGRILFA